MRGIAKAEEKESRQTQVKLDSLNDGNQHKIRSFVQRLDGVGKVTLDTANKKLTAIGKIYPSKLKKFLEAETKSKVEVIFPKEPPKEEKKEEKKDNDVNDPTKSSEYEKRKPPPVSTVVLKIRPVPDRYIHQIKKNISKIKGVQEVTVDATKDLVTVKSTMDAKTLRAVLKENGVEVVPPKKHASSGSGGDKKKDKGGDGGGGEKREEDGGGGEKKENEGRGGVKKKKAVATATTKTVAEANRTGCFGRFLR